MVEAVALHSLRARLLLVVGLAVIPAFGLIVHTALEQRRDAVRDVQESALRLARLAASEQGRRLAGARNLLIALSRLPDVRRPDTPACHRLLADLLPEYPLYLNLGVIDPRGRLVCSALPVAAETNLADRAYFQRAVDSRNFAIGDFQIGRVTGKASVNVAYPVLDRGAVTGVIFAAIDLDWLNQLVRDARLPEGSTFTVIDRHGTVLVRHPERTWVGRAYPDSDLVELVRSASAAGIGELAEPDGVPRLLGFSPLLDGGRAGDVYVSIGIPVEAAVSDANRLLLGNLAGLGVVAVLAVAAVWYAGDVFVVRRVRGLVAASRRLAAGDLSATSGGPYGGEIGELARAFDEMAAALRARERELARHHAALLQTEKLAAIGRLAAGVAHELRNPLTVIDGRVQLLEREAARGQVDPAMLGRHLASFQEAAQRMRGIMNGLSSYCKPARAEPGPLDVGELLAAAGELVGHEARSRDIALEVDVAPDLPPVLGERSEMMQVLVNLATNGIEAMASGGHLRLRGRLDGANGPGPGGPAVLIEVQDDGPGIPADRLAAIWEPFYTTKAEGTGLGLSIVRGLVDKQPGASIGVESAPGRGTTFRLRMPVSPSR